MKLSKFTIIRLCLYTLLCLFILSLCVFRYMDIPCFFKENFDIVCPSCGVSNATINILKLNFTEAFKHNFIFTTVIFPLSVFLIIEDIVCLFSRRVVKKKSMSLIQVVVGGGLDE